MKWIVVILVLLNVAAYLLGQKVDPGAFQATGAGQLKTVNSAAMTVIKPTRENLQPVAAIASNGVMLEEDNLAQLKVDKRGQVLMAPTETENVNPVDIAPVPVIAANNAAKKEANAAQPVEVAKIAEPEPASTSKNSSDAALLCYRLGPFSDQNSLAAVRRKLENRDMKYSVDGSEVPGNIKAVRLYLGAFSSTTAMEAEKKRLKEMKIEHFVIRLNGTPLVQLGYFSEPARATSYQRTLKSRGIDAKKDIIYHAVNIKSWLDVQLVSKDAIGALELPKNVKAKEQACR